MMPRQKRLNLQSRYGAKSASKHRIPVSLLRYSFSLLLLLVVISMTILNDRILGKEQGRRMANAVKAPETKETATSSSNNADASSTKAATATTTYTDNVWTELLETVTKDKLDKLARDLKEQYASAQPFPHIIIDDLFPLSILQAVMAEAPESIVDTQSGCIPPPLFQCQTCIESQPDQPQYRKSALNQEENMGPYTRMLASFFKSGIFVDFLNELTGIPGLLPDPFFIGSGIHFTSNGGKLEIHADMNQYPPKELKLDRRVNTFLYLNPDWLDHYGGHLEFWTPDMTQCKARIAPILGRFVVFTTTDFSYHGHPEPLTAPPGRARRSMANYFYTAGQERPTGTCIKPRCPVHGTLFQKPRNGCSSCLDPACNALPVPPLPSTTTT